MQKKTPVRQRSWRNRSLVLTRQRVIAAAAAAALVLGGTASGLGYFALVSGTAQDRVATAAAEVSDREAATKAGSEFLTTMFTVNDGSLTRWDSAVLASTTDSMHEQLGQWRTVLDKLVKAHLEMSSTIKDIGVVSYNGDAVTLLAVIESVGRTDPDATEPGTNYSAALVDMRKQDGHWKVSSYGPAGGMPPAAAKPPAPTTDAPAPDPTPR